MDRTIIDTIPTGLETGHVSTLDRVRSRCHNPRLECTFKFDARTALP